MRKTTTSKESFERALLLVLCGFALAQAGCRETITRVVKEKRIQGWKVPREPLPRLNYIVQFPRGYDGDTNRLWPLVLYLHGIGERGDNLDRVLRFGPPKIMAEGKDLPCIVVSPQLPDNYFTFRESNALLALLDEVIARYRVDKRRVHLTGNSMGGYGAVLLAAREPRRFASLVPVCGGVDYLDSVRLRDVPIWAFHGEKDLIIPMEESRRLVELVKRVGGNARLTIYPDLGHNCWDRAYNDPDLWDWMLAQKK